MASRTFVTGSKIFEITDYSAVKSINNKYCIQSERFKVGGYYWVIRYFPQGDTESTADHVSVFVKVQNPTKEFWAIYSFCFMDWNTQKWSFIKHSSSQHKFLPSSEEKGFSTYIKRSDLEKSSYLRDNIVKLRCTLFVITPPPTPAPALKSDDNEEYPKWSKNSSKYGFHILGYAPPNAPSNMCPDLPRQPTVRIYCEAIKDFSVTARNGTVVLAPADPSDHYQHWVKVMSYGDGDKDKDIYGCRTFALVNRVTGEALKNPGGENEEVSLVPYNTNHNLMKWSTDFIAIWIPDKQWFNMTAIPSCWEDKFNDGAKIDIKKWENKSVQHWNIVPYNSNVPYKL